MLSTICCIHSIVNVIDGANLILFPEFLLQQLQHATTSLDVEQGMEVVELIKAINVHLADQLAQHINQFDFATINQLFPNATD
jgi:hypothetical protein